MVPRDKIPIMLIIFGRNFRKKMETLVYIGGGVAIVFGFFVMLNKGVGNKLAGVSSAVAGIIAIGEESFIPLIIGFALLWVFRLIGLEKG